VARTRSARCAKPTPDACTAPAREMRTSWRLTPRARLESDRAGSTGILLDTYSAAMSTCNDTAWTLLRRLKHGASVEGLARELVARHRAAPRSARADALNFVRRLRRMGLVDATP
jgi:hypothetical protein